MKLAGLEIARDLYFVLLLVILGLNEFCSSQNIEVQTVEDVVNKLERFDAGQSTSSTLTIDELRVATKQFLGWGERTKESFRRQFYQLRLLEDFLFIPMSRTCHFSHNNGGICDNDDDEQIQQAQVRRLELFYKQFKPAYQGQMLGYEYARSRKTELLLASLLDLKNHQPLTSKMLVDAHKEYKAHQKRAQDITLHEDIFANADDLRLELNYLNRSEVKLLAEKIFPILSSDLPLDSIKLLYQIDFSKLDDYKIVDGQIVKLVPY